MSGHSKWSNIKHRKGKSDAVKARIFTKIGREIAVAVKSGGTDPNTNGRLFDAIEKARLNNMPNDNVLRSIKKASGELNAINYESIVYEGYGAAGVAVIVDALTDNRNRTVGDVRHFFDKYGGGLGSTGCVAFMFDRKGLIVAERGKKSEDEVMTLVIDAGADDVNIFDEEFEVYTVAQSLSAVKSALEKNGVKLLSAEVRLIPQNTVDIEGDDLLKFETLIDKLEELDDVQNVYHNANLPDTNTDTEE
jgi:YebC/PmpR family DNA-binding regulatory protein